MRGTRRTSPSPSAPRHHARRALRVLALAALPIAACGGGPETGSAPGPDAVYQVRGEIARLPDPGSPEIWIRHETIPDFRNASGEAVGMDSMTMPFGIDSSAALESFAVGDRISFRLEIDWDAPTSPSRVVDLRRLDPGTRLEFDPAPEAEPDAADQPEAPGAAEPAPGGEGDTPR